jgi:hypothetical protein
MTSSMDPNAGFNGIETVTPGSGAVRQVDFALTAENLDTETNSSHTFSDIIVTGTSVPLREDSVPSCSPELFLGGIVRGACPPASCSPRMGD